MLFASVKSVSRVIGVLSAAALSVALTGCGAGSSLGPAATHFANVGGHVMGGPSPVNGATVNLYATGSGSYGATATLLAHTTTQADGSFSFTGASTCASPAQVYITASGGNPGAGTNANYLLMAALGDCSTISTSSVIWVNEVTTVAAAYALSNFISISGTTVNIGAPTTQTQGAGSCSGTGSGMTCGAAGLAHAFQNALNLVSSIGTASALPTGTAYSYVPSSLPAAVTALTLTSAGSGYTSAPTIAISGGGGSGATATLTYNTTSKLITAITLTAGGSGYTSVPTVTISGGGGTGATATVILAAATVPTQLINSLANSIQVCVNSTGGSATDTSTPCGKLFSYATPPVTSSATPVAPTNTLQALINMAKFPQTNAASIYGLPSGFTTYYSPNLTAAPHDLSLAIAYKGYTSGATSAAFGYPYFLSLDANDNVYVITQPSSSGTPTTAVSLTSNGVPNWVSGTVTTTACAAGVPCLSAPDTTGTLWVSNGSTSAGKLIPVGTATGTVGTPVTLTSTAFGGVAVDKSNNVYLSVPTASATASVYVLPSGGTTLSPVQVGSTPANFSTVSVPLWLALDSSSNIWIADKYTASTTSVTSEILAPATTSSTYTSGNSQTVDTVASSSTGDSGLYGLVVNDVSGTAYANNGIKFFVIPAGNTAQTTVTITDGTATAVSARYSAIDGAGHVFLPDNNGNNSYVWQYLPVSGTYAGGFQSLLPCISVTIGATTCGVGATGALQGPRGLAVDSTGSIWVASSTNSNVVQIIGTAAPTWPQLSYLNTGVAP